MGYSNVANVPHALKLLRSLLREDRISVDADAPEALAAIKLHVSGMVSIDSDDRYAMCSMASLRRLSVHIIQASIYESFAIGTNHPAMFECPSHVCE